ncbi:MAG: hypothetical protein ACTSUG_08755 [Candidatus Helarchaeota archaeon]
MYIKKNIFGITTAIDIKTQNKTIQNTIETEFALYPDSVEDIELLIYVHNGYNINIEATHINPSIHFEIENGFAYKEQKFDISYQFNDDITIVNLYLHEKGNNFILWLKKINNIEFASIKERVGQIIHENILIPYNFSKPKRALIHSSSFLSPTGKNILIGGTGGVGKTSLEIELCMNKGYKFFADDISVINRNKIFPNLAFPKIYAYNVVGNKQLKNEIFKNCSFFNRLVWEVKKTFFGPNKTRRKINPNLVYKNGVSNKSVDLDSYFILSKGNYSELSIKEISAKDAAFASINVIKTEYFNFINHLYWHEFNAQIHSYKPIFKINEILNIWTDNLSELFKDKNTYIINIPQNMTHKNFINSVTKMIIEKIN